MCKELFFKMYEKWYEEKLLLSNLLGD